MSAAREIEVLLRAKYPILYVVSWEERRVEEALQKVCSGLNRTLHTWTLTQGVRPPIGKGARAPLTSPELEALALAHEAPEYTVFLLKDFHPYMKDHRTIRLLRDLASKMRSKAQAIVILAPSLVLPSDLEKEVTVVEFPLPDAAEIEATLDQVMKAVANTKGVDATLEPSDRERLVKSAQGLTMDEIESVFARSLVEKKRFDVEAVLKEKQQIIRKSGLLEYYAPDARIKDVGGMELLKEWLDQRTKSFSDKAREFGLPAPKGILLLGVQGCGKSLLAKAVAAGWNLPLLKLDVGRIFGSLVGQSEENIRKAIAVAESVAPCLSGDARVTLTSGAERTMAELWAGQAEGFDVWGMDEGFRTVPVRVRAVIRRPAPDLARVSFRHGHLDATANHRHPVLREGRIEWVRTDGLKPGDHLALPRRLPTREAEVPTFELLPSDARLYFEGALAHARPGIATPQRRYAARNRGGEWVRPSEIDAPPPPLARLLRVAVGRGGTADSALARLPETVAPEWGYLLGLIASDGYLGKDRRVGFVNTDLSLHARFAGLVRDLFGIEARRRLQTAPGGGSGLPGTGPESQFRPCFASYADGRLLVRLLRSSDERLLEMPLDVLRAWVRGYFDGDGCVSCPATAPPRVILTAKRPAENRRLRAVLHRIGFPTTDPDHHDATITGHADVRRFAREVGSEHPMRRARLEAWLEAPLPAQPKERRDPIPVGGLLREARAQSGVASHRLAGASSGLVHLYETGKAAPSRARLARILPELRGEAAEAIRRLVEGDATFSPVQSVESMETPEHVYDLACDAPHTFVANGAFTHNCVLWADELEKGFAGVGGSGASDSGTTARVFATFLTWMSEKTAPVFLIATANDVTALPPEMLRKGRFDEIFFVDLPDKEERAQIFAIHLGKRNRPVEKFDLQELAAKTHGFSGAEIEQVVVGALYTAFDKDRELEQRDMVEEAIKVVPLSVMMAEEIGELREWAALRTRPSSKQDGD